MYKHLHDLPISSLIPQKSTLTNSHSALNRQPNKLAIYNQLLSLQFIPYLNLHKHVKTPTILSTKRQPLPKTIMRTTKRSINTHYWSPPLWSRIKTLSSSPSHSQNPRLMSHKIPHLHVKHSRTTKKTLPFN